MAPRCDALTCTNCRRATCSRRPLEREDPDRPATTDPQPNLHTRRKHRWRRFQKWVPVLRSVVSTASPLRPAGRPTEGIWCARTGPEQKVSKTGGLLRHPEDHRSALEDRHPRTDPHRHRGRRRVQRGRQPVPRHELAAPRGPAVAGERRSMMPASRPAPAPRTRSVVPAT